MTKTQLDESRLLFDFLLPQVMSEQAITQKIVAAVPVGKEGFKPGLTGMGAFELSRHITVLEIWFFDAIISGQFGDVPSLPESATTCPDVAAWYADTFADRLSRLRELSSSELSRRVNFHDLRNDPAVAYLNIALRHSVHHRGQLSAYLRGMGAKVPAIYVESADEPYPPIDDLPADYPKPPCF